MTTTHTSVTDAEVEAAMTDRDNNLPLGGRAAMRIALEQFAQSRQPSSEPDDPDKYCITTPDGGCISKDPRCMHQPRGEAVELPRITNSLRQCQIGERCECGSDYKDCAFYLGDDTTATKAAHPQQSINEKRYECLRNNPTEYSFTQKDGYGGRELKGWEDLDEAIDKFITQGENK